MSEENQAPQEEGQSRAQKRIDQLTKKFHDADRAATEAQAAIVDRDTRIAALEAKIDSLSRPQAPEPKAETGLFGKSSPPPAIDADSIRSIVQEAISPVVQQVTQQQQALQQQAEAEQLYAVQNQAFQEAAQDLPNVLTPGTTEQAMFAEVWNARSDLRQLHDGPALVVRLVRDALSDTVGSPQVQPETKKSLASPPQPSSQPRQRFNEVQRPKLSEAQQAAQDVRERLQQPGGDYVTDAEQQLLIADAMKRLPRG